MGSWVWIKVQCKKIFGLESRVFLCFLHLAVSKFLSEVLVFSSKGLSDPLRS